MNRVSQILFGAFFLLFALSNTVNAGWLISEADGQETFISKGKMKSDWDNGSVIIDAGKNELYFIDDGREMIASGNVDEICSEMKQMIESMMANIPAEQREMMKKMMGGGKEPKVEVVKKESGGKVAGFETTRYEVMSDGNLYEELWLTEDKALMKDCATLMKMMGKFASCMQSMSAMGASASPEASPEYAKIYELGVIVKSVSHSENETGLDTEIISFTEKDVPDEIFALPDGYKRVSFQTLWGMDEEE